MEAAKPINWKRRAETNGEYGCMGDLGMHVFHLPLRLGWRPRNVRAILSKVVRERPDASGNLVPCDTWDNATLFCEVPAEGGAGSFPLTAKTFRIAPGETDTWYISVKGMRFSARFSTKRPRTLETLDYSGVAQIWQSEDLGYESAYRAITGKIFEFGFCDAILQMLAAFCDEAARAGGGAVPFGCATSEEARWTHAIFTAALASHRAAGVARVECP
jgi:predicted dehydrogenase